MFEISDDISDSLAPKSFQLRILIRMSSVQNRQKDRNIQPGPEIQCVLCKKSVYLYFLFNLSRAQDLFSPT